MKTKLLNHFTSISCVAISLLFAMASSAATAEILQDRTSSQQQIISSGEIQQGNRLSNANSTPAEEITGASLPGIENIENVIPENENLTALENFKKLFSADLRILAYGIVQNPAQSDQNPHNDFLEIPHYIIDAQIRPDFYFDSRFLDLSFKPRSTFTYNIWKEGIRDGDAQ
jgi:hypothetical protein